MDYFCLDRRIKIVWMTGSCFMVILTSINVPVR